MFLKALVMLGIWSYVVEKPENLHKTTNLRWLTKSCGICLSLSESDDEWVMLFSFTLYILVTEVYAALWSGNISAVQYNLLW